jgi:hypothetical protein
LRVAEEAKQENSVKQATSTADLFHAGFLFGIFFDRENGGEFSLKQNEASNKQSRPTFPALLFLLLKLFDTGSNNLQFSSTNSFPFSARLHTL